MPTHSSKHQSNQYRVAFGSTFCSINTNFKLVAKRHWTFQIRHHVWQKEMLVFAARTKQAIGQMCPCAHSGTLRLHANAFLQFSRQTYTYIGKYDRIDRSKHEISQLCLRHGACHVCLCRARIYQLGILINHVARWVDSQWTAARVCCTCAFWNCLCLQYTSVKQQRAFERRNVMLVNATLNEEGKCSAFYKALLCIGFTDCWMKCMMKVQSSWTLHWHIRKITDE